MGIASGGAVPSAVQATLPGVGAPVAAHADSPMSAAVQARWDHIAAELRCLVCQNESLASSNAELAVDLRREVRSLIEQGQSDADIRSFLVKRYGDFVLYRPPLKFSTVLLWAGPFVLLLVAAVGLGLGQLFERVPVLHQVLRHRTQATLALAAAVGTAVMGTLVVGVLSAGIMNRVTDNPLISC